MFNFNVGISQYLMDIYAKIPVLEEECLRCGECCKSDVQLAFIEYLNIKQYIVDHNIKPLYNNEKCIFLFLQKNHCIIYPVRPWICRAYRPIPKKYSVYYVDIKKKRTTERCGYNDVEFKQGKPQITELGISSFMIVQLQQSLKEVIDAPDYFFKKDNTFVNWQKECIFLVRRILAR